MENKIPDSVIQAFEEGSGTKVDRDSAEFWYKEGRKSRETEEEDTIIAIRQRIRDEFRKHPSIDWAYLAAKKIYMTYFKPE